LRGEGGVGLLDRTVHRLLVTSTSLSRAESALAGAHIGGTTDFLSATSGEVLHSVVPRRGSILLFPHEALHEGTGVGADSKFLLRGDLL